MQTQAPSSPDLARASASAGAPCWRDRSLVLVGMMGAGKSWLGKPLAAQLKRPFRDADAELERAERMSIADMFARFGEAHFRAREHEMLVQLLQGPLSVIAAGGGAFAHAPTHRAIQAHAISVWLNTDRTSLLRRLRTETGRRPLLPSNANDLPRALARLAAARHKWYRQAHIVIAPPEDAARAVQLVMQRLQAASA